MYYFYASIRMAKSKNNDNKKYIRLFWLLFASPFLFLGLLIAMISMGVFGKLPSFEELENPKSMLASQIISADQKILGTYYKENRTNAEFQELPQHLVDALIATEDARFYDHSGIDFRALGRVVKGIVTMNMSQGGGSTITQQFVKQFFDTRKNIRGGTPIQKLAEWIIAVQIEKRYTKKEIIALYFNQFDFLHNAVGVKTASSVYFGTKPDSLKLEEAAMLVGMAKNPALFNPRRRADTTEHRRNVVMMQMVKYGYLEKTKYDSLKQIPLQLRYHSVDHNEGSATYFREFLRGELIKWCRENKKPDGSTYDIYRDGLKIYTTINSKMQAYAEEAVREHLSGLQESFFKEHKGRSNAPFYKLTSDEVDKVLKQAMKRSERYRKMKQAKTPMDSIELSFRTPTEMSIFTWKGEIDTVMTPMDSIRYYKHFLNTGFMSMDPNTGYVKAWVGGINYKHFKYDQVYYGKRQVGSTFKPFVYALAIQEGYSPCHKVLNRPYTFEKGTFGLLKNWTPRNSDHKHEGEEISLKYALANSVNYVTAWAMKQYGPEAVINLVRKMGITSPIEPVPSICLGTPDVSVYEMVGANATFANKGVYTKPVYITRIEDKNGNILQEFVPQTNEAMNEETAYVTLNLLEGVVQGGSGVRLRYRYKLNNPIAGKTGTTQNHSDGWFMGLTPDLVSGVWVGCEDRSAHFRGMALGQGASMALPIWALYMKKVYADPSLKISQGPFEKPSTPIKVELDCKVYNEQNKKAKDSKNQYD